MLQKIKPKTLTRKNIEVNSKVVTAPSFLEARGLKLSLDSITIKFLAADKKNILAQLAVVLSVFLLGIVFSLLIL